MIRWVATITMGWYFAMTWVTAVVAEESTIKLKEVVVTATRTEKEPQDVTQTVTVITADDIRKSGELTVSDIIEQTTGVAVSDYGTNGALSTVSIRGSSYQQVLVLLDGRRLNSASAGGYDMSNLPVSLDDIERIEIVRGPSSAVYGADAVGGVVNIITKTPSTSRTAVRGEAGSFGYQSLNLNNGNKFDKFYYSLSVGKEKSDGFRVNSDLDKTLAGIKLGYELTTNSSVELAMDYLEKEIGVPGSLQFPSPLAREWDRNGGGSLTYRSKLTKDFDIRLNVYNNRDKIIYKDPNPSFPVDSRHISTSNGGEAQANWIINSWNLLTVGMEARRDHLNSSDAGEHSASLWAAYVQDEISIGDSLIVVIGGRNDSHSVYGDKFSPHASARYLVAGTGTLIRVSAGEAYRAPTLNDLFWPFDGFEVGNENLKPETSTEYEGGIEQPFGQGNAVKVTVFERKVKDMIQWIPDANFIYSPQNIGRVNISGYEAEAKFAFYPWLTWSINYTYMDPVDETTGKRIYNTIPSDQLKSSLYLALPSKTNISVEGRRVKNYVQPGDISYATAPSSQYEVVDARLSQVLNFGSQIKGELYVGEKNIFNKDYQVSAGYPMPPREFYGGVSILF
jgi:outer membrane cobalamin receptor